MPLQGMEPAEPSLRDLRLAVWQVQRARTDLENRERELANLGLDPDELPDDPTVPLWTLPVFTLSVGFTMSMAFYELVFSQLIPGQNAAIVAGLVAGALVCLPVVWGMIDSANRPQSASTNLMWIAVSLGLFGALLLMRLGQVDTSAETMLALGMAILELLMLVALKLLCSAVGRQRTAILAERLALETSQRQVAAARLRYERILDETRAAPSAYLSLLDDPMSGETLAGRRVVAPSPREQTGEPRPGPS
jgi:hypothetical protein